MIGVKALMLYTVVPARFTDFLNLRAHNQMIKVVRDLIDAP